MDRESSDEEEDRRNLINLSTIKSRISAFEIGHLSNRISRHFAFNRLYLIAVCSLLLITILFFSVHLGGMFRTVPVARTNSRTDHMRESELHALYLLRNQQSGLLDLWNQTTALSTTTDNSSVPPHLLFDNFRSALLQQIKLNNQIQQSLLSSHQSGSALALTDDGFDRELGGFGGGDSCRKVNELGRNRTIEWKPKANRYLFAICLSGQMSNHLICLEKHMFFAALLKRVLILPSPKIDYQYDHVVNIEHINKCFGRRVVMSFEEYSEMKKKHLRIDRFICYMAKPTCFMDDEHVKKLKSVGISMGKIEAAWPDDGKPDESKKRTVTDILPKFSCKDEVLAIGDVFYANVEDEWVMQPGGPLAHKCKTVIQPSSIIVDTAQRFVQTFLGGNFIALHLRRHGFLKFCNAKKESCFFPIPQATECILRVVEKSDAPVIYLSTDAAKSETDLLQSMTVLKGKEVPLVKRPSHTSAEKWDALLYKKHISGDTQVEAMLDKTICAMSKVFIGSSGSTFTEDIFRLRRDWGSASMCDEYLCKGEQPNFLADPK